MDAVHDTFKLYVGNYIYEAGQPTIIVTADTAIEIIAYGECFIFMDSMHDDKIKYYEQLIEFDTTGAPIDINLPFMLNEALIQANILLSQHLYNYYDYTSQSDKYFIRDHYQLEESDNSALLWLVIKNKFSPQLERIRNLTKSQSLRGFLIPSCDQISNIRLSF